MVDEAPLAAELESRVVLLGDVARSVDDVPERSLLLALSLWVAPLLLADDEALSLSVDDDLLALVEGVVVEGVVLDGVVVDGVLLLLAELPLVELLLAELLVSAADLSVDDLSVDDFALSVELLLLLELLFSVVLEPDDWLQAGATASDTAITLTPAAAAIRASSVRMSLFMVTPPNPLAQSGKRARRARKRLVGQHLHKSCLHAALQEKKLLGRSTQGAASSAGTSA